MDANLVLSLMPTNATIEWAIISTVEEDREANRILDVVASLFVGEFDQVLLVTAQLSVNQLVACGNAAVIMTKN